MNQKKGRGMRSTKVFFMILSLVSVVFCQYGIHGYITGPRAPGLQFKVNFTGKGFPSFSTLSTSFDGVDRYYFIKTFTSIWEGTTSIQAVTPGYRFIPDSFPNDILGAVGTGIIQKVITHTFKAIDTAKPTIINIKIGTSYKQDDTATLKWTQIDNSNSIGSRKIYIGYGTTWTMVDSTIKDITDNIATLLDTVHANRTLKFVPRETGLFKMKIVMGDNDSNFTTAYSDTFRIIPKNPTAIKIPIQQKITSVVSIKIFNLKGQPTGKNYRGLLIYRSTKSKSVVYIGRNH